MDSDSLPIFFVIAAIINLIIFYFIIKAGVRSGSSEVERALHIMINMKAEEMKKQGFTDEDIATIIKRVK